MEELMKDKVEQLVDYIMKHCLWQFHSRAWDRKAQNEEIITRTMQLMCDEEVKLETPADKCYWVDAVYLEKGFKNRFSWISEMENTDIKLLMQELKDRMDYLTITGSLNQELVDPLY
ncbi:MAG: Fe-only nitrogenase subunit delta [Ruminiclostridium sp.]